MTIRDKLAGEIADHEISAQKAASGQSMTGFSGRHTDMFGGREEPIVGDRVRAMDIRNAATEGLDDLIGSDPMFRNRQKMAANRQPFGNQEQQLAVENRPGYRRYWFSDQPGRVARALRAGYEHVRDPDNGDNMARITDRADGRGRSSYLMEIPIEWYQEDMKRQADALSRRLDDIRTGRAGPGSDDNRYIPRQGIKISGR